MAYSKETQAKYDRLEKIASRALALLRKSPHPKAEMEWAEHLLREEGLFQSFQDPEPTPGPWVELVIAQSLDMKDHSLPWLEERDIHPEKAENFEELILSLIPKEGGL